MKPRILVVEDEPAILDLLEINLRHAGYQPVLATDAATARKAIAAERPDLVLLDWMLPDQSGLEIARRLRADPLTQHLPLIMLTARSAESDLLGGFNAGVDDYITKPFSPRELVARIQAVLRRRPPAADEPIEPPLEIGGLRLEPATFRLYGDGTLLRIGPTEFRLLTHLMRHPDRVLSRAQLLDGVWGREVAIEERTVDVHIRRLRLALQATGHDRLIETVRGGGYRFLPQ